MMRCLPSILVSLTLLLSATGCASTGNISGNNVNSNKSSTKGAFGIKPLTTGSFTSSGNYILSADEKSQDCKRIRGKMGVRIVQLQRTGIVRDSSTLSHKFKGFFGGGRSLDAASVRKRDRAVLVAYNELLARKKCPTVDLETELAKRQLPRSPRGSATKPQTR